MNKAELFEKLSTETGVPKKDVEAVIDGFTKITTETLQRGEEVTLTGFGAFMAKVRHARMGVNPRKPTEKIEIPEVTVPKFKAGKALKDALKSGSAPASESTAPAEPENKPEEEASGETTNTEA